MDAAAARLRRLLVAMDGSAHGRPPRRSRSRGLDASEPDSPASPRHQRRPTGRSHPRRSPSSSAAPARHGRSRPSPRSRPLLHVGDTDSTEEGACPGLRGLVILRLIVRF